MSFSAFPQYSILLASFQQDTLWTFPTKWVDFPAWPKDWVHRSDTWGIEKIRCLQRQFYVKWLERYVGFFELDQEFRLGNVAIQILTWTKSFLYLWILFFWSLLLLYFSRLRRLYSVFGHQNMIYVNLYW